MRRTRPIELSDAHVYRGGVTARAWAVESDDVTLSRDERFVYLRFSLKSKGGGTTGVDVGLGPDAFMALTEGMLAVDPGFAVPIVGALVAEALKAQRLSVLADLAAVVASEVAAQPGHDARAERLARQSVVRAARQAAESAPPARKRAARQTSDAIRRLVEALDAGAVGGRLGSTVK